jgi:hypothetical protein
MRAYPFTKNSWLVTSNVLYSPGQITLSCLNKLFQSQQSWMFWACSEYEWDWHFCGTSWTNSLIPFCRWEGSLEGIDLFCQLGFHNLCLFLSQNTSLILDVLYVQRFVTPIVLLAKRCICSNIGVPLVSRAPLGGANCPWNQSSEGFQSLTSGWGLKSSKDWGARGGTETEVKIVIIKINKVCYPIWRNALSSGNAEHLH